MAARLGEALTQGSTTAYMAGGGALLIIAVVVALAINTRRTQGNGPATSSDGAASASTVERWIDGMSIAVGAVTVSASSDI